MLQSLKIELIKNIKECGEIMKNASQKNVFEKNNNYKDLVTDYDILIENKIKDAVSNLLPNASFLGEEGNKIFDKSGFCFICDPIDGTANFVNDYKVSGISLALLEDGQPILGVIYNPYLDELFVAEKNKGATCNGKTIKTTTKDLKHSLVVFGTGTGKGAERVDECFDLAKYFYLRSSDIRRSGSAVIDLTNIASGRTGLFFELELQPWDFAAGVFIINEAGGIVLDYDGNEVSDFFNPSSIFAFGSKKEAENYCAFARLQNKS